MSDKKMNGAASLVRSLEHAGVDVMFGIPAVQFCRLTIRYLTAVFATFWFVMNKEPDMRQPVMPKRLGELAFA